jgi:hypothetical protein
MADNINDFKKQISDLKKQMNEMLKDAGGDALARAAIKAKPEYKALIVQLKEINSQVLEVKQTTQDYVDSLTQQQSKAKELKGIYTQLGKLDLQRVEKQAKNLKMDADKVKQFEKISELNQQLAQLSAEDSISRQLIQKQIESELADLEGSRGIHSHIVKNLKQQFEFAKNISNLTEGQKEQLEAQVEVYESIKKSIGGIFDTLSILTSGPMGALGMGLIGAGFAADKLGKNIRSFGGFIDSAQFSALGLSFIFEDAEETAKSLSKQFGGLKDVSLSTQLNTNLMATNMGISGEEAANVVGSFARLNNMSADTAMDMAATTKSMAKAAGVPVDQVMKDVAGSAEKFAEYGKDGGINIAKAAVSAAKLGVGMDSLTKVTDSLLDFETSINSELELGAMLGRNINLDRARALAYEGNIGGAVKETLQSLGGIEEFNKMDIFQKRKAAELLGLSVDEFQKMAANSDKLNDDGSIQQSQWSTIWESITGAATASGGFLKTMGGMVLGAAQMGGSFAQMGMDVKGMASKIPVIGKLFKGGAPGGAPSTAATPSAGGGAPGADKAGAFGKMNTTALLKGAAALLILGAALYVFAKAANAFGDDINWPNVFIGIGAMTLLGGVAAILGTVGPMILVGAAALLVASAAFYVFGIASQEVAKGMAMMGEALPLFAAGMVAFADAPYIQFGLGMVGLAASMLVLGAAAPFMMLAGAGLMMVTNALNALTPTIPVIMEQMSALSQINFMPIFGLATALTVLSAALAAVAVSGMLALPALLALGLIAGGAAAIMGGGEGGEDAKMDELINEIKALRGDLLSGKIGVNMDGQKVTAKVSSVVDKISSNSYAKV